MANHASINSEFSDLSDLNASFNIKFVNSSRAIDVTYTWICKASRSTGFEYVQGTDGGDQGDKALSAVSTDIAASSISAYMNVSIFVDAFEIEANEYGWVITDEGSTGTTNITLTEVPEVLPVSGYAEKYKYYFHWENLAANTRYKVSILEDGYAGIVTTLEATAKPWIQAIEGQLDTNENPILGSQAKFEIITSGSGYTTYDADFLNSDYKDFIVKLIADPDGTPAVKWTGILLPSNASRNWVGYFKTYSLSAVDGLADLKNKKYSTDGESTGSQLNGFDDMLSIIKTSLATVADITELQLPFRIQLGTFSDQMTSTENAFKESEIVQELFSQTEDGELKYDSCYDVLKKILTSFDCSMGQINGYYWIWCNGEDDSFYFEYDWATLAQQARTSNNRSIDISDYVMFGENAGTLYKTAPYRSFNVRLFNKNYDPELIVNGGFDSVNTGWTNGDADDSSNTWTFFGWFNDPGVGGTLKTTYSAAATAGKYNFHSTNSIVLDVGAGKENVELTVIAKYSDTNPTGLSDPKIKMRLWNGTNGYLTGTKGSQTVTTGIGTYVTYTETFDVTGLTVAANYLDVEIEATDALTEVIEFTFDNISMTQDSAETPRDWLYRGLRTSGSQSVNKEEVLYIAEKQESDNDICAIKDAGGTYTSTWSRYGETDDLPLIEILQQYVFNSNRRYMSYTKGMIYDPDETINAFNVLANDDSAFRIIGMQKDYYRATIKLDLIEVVFTTVGDPDITFNSSALKLESIYGESAT